MKLILDTNVFVSGVFFKGPPFQIVQAWRDGIIQLVVSLEIISEYERVGEKLQARFGNLAFNPVMTLLLCQAIVVDAPETIAPV